MRLHYKIAEKFDYRLKKKNRAHDFLDTHLALVLKQLNVDVVLDAGANIGQYGLFLRDLGFKGRIISFEPLKDAFLDLNEKAEKDGNWLAFNFALGERNDQKTMRVIGKNGKTDFSSFLNPTAESIEHFSLSRKETEDLIAIKTLDSVLASLDLSPISRVHLKLDTQGFDLQVFAGAKAILPNVFSMQSEVSFKPIYEGMPSYLEALDVYNKAGFIVSGLFPVSRHNKELYLFEADAVMTRVSKA